MKIEKTAISGVLRIYPSVHGDDRGRSIETFERTLFTDNGITDDFHQDFLTASPYPGTVRGLHFQTPPFAQSKLVRAARGRIFDVVVDLRRASATYGRHVTFGLESADGSQVYVPVGCAHGYCTLAPDTEVAYKIAGAYAPDHAKGLLWNDPAIGIDWPVTAEKAILSDKDAAWPGIGSLGPVFD